MKKTFALALVLVLALASGTRAEEVRWQPEKTFAFVASTIEWKDSAFAPFTDARRDDALVAQLEKDGVAKDRLVYLRDKAATREAILRDLEATAARAGEGSTFVFYFQGHGDRVKQRTYLACWDASAGDLEHTSVAVDDVARILAKSFQGDRVLAFADCCHAGALATLAERLGSKRVGILTSAMASNASTEHWTFTEALIAGFAGDGLLDRDGNGAVTFGELDRHAHDAMKFEEHQLTRGVRSKTFEEDFVVRPVAKPVRRLPGAHQIGEWVTARDREGKWYDARILDEKDGKFLVHYVGWDPKWDEWIGPELLRPIAPPRKLEIGQHYEVVWHDGKWYPATVVRAEEDFFYFVHYEGEAGDDDEWMTAERARAPQQGKSPPEFAAKVARPAGKGDAVAARWKTDWYLGTVTEVTGAKVDVTYADDDKGTLAPEEVIVLGPAGELAEGDRVLACWNGKPRMFPGKLAKKGTKTCTVAWEDGTAPTEVPIEHLARIK